LGRILWRHGGGSLRAHRRHNGKAGRAARALSGLLGLRHRARRHPRHRLDSLAAAFRADGACAGEHRACLVGAAMKPGFLAPLASHFLVLSVLAFGGANAVIPEIHRDAVEVSRWMTDQQFADLFAISQASPGPNILIVALVGYQVAGVAGALVATAAM